MPDFRLSFLGNSCKTLAFFLLENWHVHELRVQADVMFRHLFLNLCNRYGSTIVEIGVFEEVYRLSL